MKTTVIVTISANGKVLVADNEKHQAPKEVFDFFIKKAQTAGNVILGSKTYKLFTRVFGLKDVLSVLDVVVLSESMENTGDYYVAHTPKEALSILEEKEHEEAIVLGGVSVYNAFINEGLFDLLYLSMVPIIVGDGGNIVTKEDLFIPIENINWESVTGNTLRVALSKL